MNITDQNQPKYVAVYGTLKQRESNYGVMERAGGKFLQKDTTVDAFTMYGGWGYPKVVEDGDVSQIQVEIFEVDSFEPTDRLEGHPTFFCRKEIEFEGFKEKAWMYFHPPFNGSGLDVQEDGFWSGRSQRQQML